MSKKVTTFKLELSGNEASALGQILEQVSVKGDAIQLVASLQRKIQRAANVYNRALKANPDPKKKGPKRKSNPGARGKR